MNNKIKLGVVIPVVIAIFVMIIGSNSVGLDIQETVAPQVDKSKLLVKSGESRNVFPLVEYDVKNSYPLAKVVNFPEYIACLHNSAGLKEGEGLSIRYNEGVPVGSDADSFSVFSLGMMASSSFRPGGYTTSASARVEVPAESNMKVILLAQSSAYYDYNGASNNKLSNYDEIVVLEKDPDERVYNACRSLDERRIDKGIRIPLK